MLALTVHEDKGYLRELLKAGARGYVLKRSAAEELILAVRAVASGRLYIDPSLAGKLIGGPITSRAWRGCPNRSTSATGRPTWFG